MSYQPDCELGGAKEAKTKQRPADLKSASQIAVQTAVQNVLRDPEIPPNAAESTLFNNNIGKAECVTNRLLYQLSCVGLSTTCRLFLFRPMYDCYYRHVTREPLIHAIEAISRIPLTLC